MTSRSDAAAPCSCFESFGTLWKCKPCRDAAEPFDWNAAPDARDTRPEPVSVRFCGSCGQSTVGAPCSCADIAAANHETLQLFVPAPAPMRGQTTIEGT